MIFCHWEPGEEILATFITSWLSLFCHLLNPRLIHFSSSKYSFLSIVSLCCTTFYCAFMFSLASYIKITSLIACHFNLLTSHSYHKRWNMVRSSTRTVCFSFANTWHLLILALSTNHCHTDAPRLIWMPRIRWSECLSGETLSSGPLTSVSEAPVIAFTQSNSLLSMVRTKANIDSFRGQNRLFFWGPVWTYSGPLDGQLSWNGTTEALYESTW